MEGSALNFVDDMNVLYIDTKHPACIALTSYSKPHQDWTVAVL